MTGPTPGAGLRLIAVDDEPPALDELAFLLRRDERVAEVTACGSAGEAMRRVHEADGRAAGRVDALFVDVQMPGATGLDLACSLAALAAPPAVVFVTAHDQHAVDAFGLAAVDYVLKPVRVERLREAVRRVAEQRPSLEVTDLRADRRGDDLIGVELGGVTRFVARNEVAWVEAQGDYARLHTDAESHLLRARLSTLAEEWAPHGFAQIHRSLLVNLAHVTSVRTDDGHCLVSVGDTELTVSRRHTRAFRELLAGRTR